MANPPQDIPLTVQDHHVMPAAVLPLPRRHRHQHVALAQELARARHREPGGRPPPAVAPPVAKGRRRHLVSREEATMKRLFARRATEDIERNVMCEIKLQNMLFLLLFSFRLQTFKKHGFCFYSFSNDVLGNVRAEVRDTITPPSWHLRHVLRFGSAEGFRVHECTGT